MTASSPWDVTEVLDGGTGEEFGAQPQSFL